MRFSDVMLRPMPEPPSWAVRPSPAPGDRLVTVKALRPTFWIRGAVARVGERYKVSAVDAQMLTMTGKAMLIE